MSSPWNEYLKTNGIDRGQFPITLTGSSANCKSTILQTKTERHFVKCQVSKSADDVMCDNVHNILLLHILSPQGKAAKLKNVTKLIKSLQVPTSQDSRRYLLQYDSGYIPVDANIQEQIIGIEVSRLTRFDIENIDFEKALYNLFDLFLVLRNTWFSHNDAHLSNIMAVFYKEELNGETHTWMKLVLIDYGRCLFNVDNIENPETPFETIRKYNENLRRAAITNFNNYYNTKIINDNWLEPNQYNYLLDISTITLNVLTKDSSEEDNYFLLTNIGKDEISLNWTRNINDIDEFYFYSTIEGETASQIILNVMQNTKYPSNLYTLGVYIFAKFLESNVNTSLYYKLDNQNQNNTVPGIIRYLDFKNDEMRKHMYYKFQYMEMIKAEFANTEIPILIKYLKSCKDSLEARKTPRPLELRGGREKQQRLNIKLLLKRLLSTKLKSQASARTNLYMPTQKDNNLEMKKKLWSTIKIWIKQNDEIASNTIKNTENVNFLNYHAICKKVLQCLKVMDYCTPDQCKIVNGIAISMMNACQDNSCNSETIDEHLASLNARFDEITSVITQDRNDDNKSIVNKHIMLGLDTPPKKSTWLACKK